MYCTNEILPSFSKWNILFLREALGLLWIRFKFISRCSCPYDFPWSVMDSFMSQGYGRLTFWTSSHLKSATFLWQLLLLLFKSHKFVPRAPCVSHLAAFSDFNNTQRRRCWIRHHLVCFSSNKNKEGILLKAISSNVSVKSKHSYCFVFSWTVLLLLVFGLIGDVSRVWWQSASLQLRSTQYNHSRLK